MTSSIIPTLQNYYTATPQQQDHRSSHCTLQWRRGQLLVKSPGKVKQPYLPCLDSEQLLVDCLKHSPISLVTIDPQLGETILKFWAKACLQAHKPIFLYIPSSHKLSKQGSQSWQWLLRLIDWILAFTLLLLVSPVILGLVVLMQFNTPGSLLVREWRVGERGRLFQTIKFRTTAKQNITSLGRWMRKFGLDNLPQLFNVLRGEMSLIGFRCWTLEDAVRLSLARQRQFDILPVMTSSWEVKTESNLLHLDSQPL